MKHLASAEFWEHFNRLPENIQKLARKNYMLLQKDPRHPSLHYKSIGDYHSVRVGRDYRALGVDVEEDVLWLWIGTHAEYDQIIG